MSADARSVGISSLWCPSRRYPSRGGFTAPHRSSVDGVQLPVPGDALEQVGAAVAERDARAGYQVGDGAGDEHLARLRRGRYPGAGVDGDAGQVLTGGFDLAGVQANPDFDAQRADRVAHRACAADRPGGAGEGREQAVTGGVDLAAAAPVPLRAPYRIVGVHERPPPAAAPPRAALGAPPAMA